MNHMGKRIQLPDKLLTLVNDVPYTRLKFHQPIKACQSLLGYQCQESAPS